MSFSKFFAWVFFVIVVFCAGCGPVSCGASACPGIDAGADGADPVFEPGSGFGGPQNTATTLPPGSPDGGAEDAQ